MEAGTRQILAEQLTKNDRSFVNANGEVTGSLQKYVLSVMPEDLLATIRAIALDELNVQVKLHNNQPSQIIVDNMSVARRGIDYARRRVQIRFQDTSSMLGAVKEAYDLLQRVTRLQTPAKDAIVARNNFYLFLNNVNLGQLPSALTKIGYQGVLTQDSVVRIVGPLVNYGRKLFWNPMGASSKMQFYRVRSKKNGVRFMPLKGASALSPRFKPFASRTLRRKANATSAPAETLRSMLQGATPPGRIENVGQIVKRVMKGNARYAGLHFTDGWIEHAPAIGWSKLRDPRVPAFGVMFTRKGMLNMSKGMM